MPDRDSHADLDPSTSADSGARRGLAMVAALLLVVSVVAAVTVRADGSPERSSSARSLSVDAPPATRAPTTEDSTTTTEPPATAPVIAAPATTTPPPVPAPSATPSPTTTARPAGLAGGGLYVVAPDGSGMRLLAEGQAHAPVWDPTGTHIAFVLNGRLLVVTADGLHTQLAANSTFPGRWSPDGTELAYLGDGGLSVWNVARDDRRLILAGSFSAFDWARDGSRFVVKSATSIDLVTPDGNQRTLVTTAVSDGGVALSPDGTRVGYADAELGPALLEVDSGTATPIARQQNMGWPMSWSPDGARVAFADYRDFSGNDLAIANADGSGARTVVEGGVAPAWSPDGGSIAYETCRSAGPDGRLRRELALVHVDGSGDHRLTTNGRAGEATDPAWSPSGASLAFVYLLA